MPLRLRGAALLIVGALGAVAVAAWDFSRHALSPKASRWRNARPPGTSSARWWWRCSRRSRSRGSRSAFTPRRRAPSALARRRAGRGAAGGARARRARLRGRARAQPARLHGQHLARLQRPHQPERETAAEHAGPPDGGGERARALLEGGAAGLRRPPRARLRAPEATRRRTCATKRRRSKSGTPTASSCRRSPTSGSSGLVLVLALLLAWMAAAGRPTHPFNRRWSVGARGSSSAPASAPAGGGCASASSPATRPSASAC